MSTSLPYPNQNPRKLHSPLLDGNNKVKDEVRAGLKPALTKGKRTYYNPFEENKISDNIDETLDSTLFNQNQKAPLTLPSPGKSNNKVNIRFINSLEILFKTANLLIIATGGLLSLLELINIVRIIYSGSSSFGNSILVFAVGFSGTIIATVICNGFIHLTKATKQIYLSIDEQKEKIEKLLTILANKH